MKKALITGISGQDGSYLTELLLDKGYEVHGVVRRVAFEDPEHKMARLLPFLKNIRLHAASVDSYPGLSRVVQEIIPDECYHLAAQSFVSYSFEDEFMTIESNIKGAHYILAALKEYSPGCHFYFAGSSEMFGRTSESPQNEKTRFHPRSAYGISKVAGFELTRNYREQYGLHASSGILYNHESSRRGFEFVTRKITHNAAKIKLGLAKELRLGNLDTQRDWGHARDYVKAIWLMTQQPQADDYVISTGVVRTVREFVEKAFSYLDLDYTRYVVTDPKFFRPLEENILQGDSSKAQTKLGWSCSYSFDDLVHEMVDADLRLLNT